MDSQLFSPFRLREVTFANRIVVSPMCQYSAVDGNVGAWHKVHLGALANSGAGLLFVEATAVLPEGRISPGCPGLWNDENEAAFATVLETVRAVSDVTLGIQIAHAGRKASTFAPWQGRGPVPAGQGGWQPVGPSAIPFADGYPVPQELDRAGMDTVREAFVEATRRAARLGFEVLELHSAHGYLMSSWVSPLSNRREDDYGGSLENRLRFPIEVATAVREAWPAGRPLSMRINGSDWVEGGWTPDDAVIYAAALKSAGVDIIDVSSGGVDPRQKVSTEPGYQVSFSEQVRRDADIPTIAVGLITDPHQAEAIVADGKADMVALARGMLFNPHWGLHAALALGVDVPWPNQYERAGPNLWAPAKSLVG